MFRRMRNLGQAFLLVTFAAAIIFLCGWRDAQPAPLHSPSPVVAQDDPRNIQEDMGANMLPMPVFDSQQEAVPLDPRENDLLYRPPLDVAFIFTHARDNWPLQNQLRVAAGSLLARSSAPLRLHLITDEDGFHAATKIINEVQASDQLDSRHIKPRVHKFLELLHSCTAMAWLRGKESIPPADVDADELTLVVPTDDFIPEIKASVTTLQEFFTRRANAYYRKALFFFSLHLHRLLPGLERVILMDIDIKVKGDVAELHSHFERFTPSNVIGMTPEQSPVYRHLLSVYRRHHPNTTLGGPPSEGGFPGYNSGVVLIDINKLRDSQIIKSYLERSKLEERTKHYSFQGHLGDQDLYTLIALDHPDLFYSLPCGWNRQLCDWWRNHGYQDVFDLYFNCSEELKVIHGNCKTPIPDNL
ncbi:Xyloside xylosyltransferase 1 [Chionoecetes opilio]|uniref:Xyloside xylosyltransferase 1 n=1 Tax=Chionoecetes opilio TaxID=41210 RepID=A0A8J8WFF1_CHIOP|nr:Xyloside xylosyltransferase 1 [Chionoecetes opilio]